MFIYLKCFKEKTKCCPFDKTTMVIGERTFVENRRTAGFCSQEDHENILVYPEASSLIVQINSDRWDLLSDDSEVDYFHDYKLKTTFFSISGRSEKFQKTYQAWWANRDDFEVNEFAASREEENAEEDFFGYISMLKENKEAANSLLSLWAKNIAS